jgi:integrase/recombinase XerD
MKEQRVNLKVVPDERRLKSNERYPLKLRVTFKGKRKYYSTSYDVSNEEWEIINSTDAKGNLRKIKNGIAAIETKSQKLCEEIIPFSFYDFEKEFFKEKPDIYSIEVAYNQYIAQLKANEQFSTAESYQTSLNSLKRYKNNLRFEDITKEFLQGFENWLLSKERSITTVGIYLRSLRSIMNIAKDEEIIDAKSYPFGKRKYIIPTGKNIKKALTIEQVKQIFNYEVAPGSAMERAKDYWILSYLCNGINMMDLAQLRQKDVHPTYISFIRQKTKRTTKGNRTTITIPRNNFIDQILGRRAVTASNPDQYIFGIIGLDDTIETKRKKIKQFTDVTNDWMKRIGKELGFDIKLTSYVARHSFATILVKSGAPMKLASQCLGHQSIITTEKYFAGFDLSTQAEYNKALTDFNSSYEAKSHL